MRVEDFPKEIKERMMDCQEEQGNKRDFSVFIKRIGANRFLGGFDWDVTKDGFDFWKSVIKLQDFSVFYEKYPKKKESISVNVSLDDDLWYEILNHARVAINSDKNNFKAITDKMLETYIKKNTDYGNSFEQSLDKFGLIASTVRIGDKMNRIESLTNKDSLVKDESIRDTLLDMANYAIMTVIWMDKQKEK